MQEKKDEILIWLPSPMGDAILCTPALRAIRQRFKSETITFLANPVVRRVLSPCEFNDNWLELDGSNPFAIAKILRERKFSQAILFKNSFGSAMAVFLAAIPTRIGYTRQGRGILLTDKLNPPKSADGKFKPISMTDYYCAIASWLGADTADKKTELLIDPHDENKIHKSLPEISNSQRPLIIIVPGGAFGPSKCWPSERFAKTADRLIAHHNAAVVISVADNPAEKQIAKQICDSSKNKLINLAENPISLGELKALFSQAQLIISNDTGPRHIAIALARKIVTLFGPNNPAWTDTGCENEIQIVGQAHCAPCAKPKCDQNEHLCMTSITVDMVCEAAEKLLNDQYEQVTAKAEQKFTETSKSFFIDPEYQPALNELSLNSLDAVFSFTAGTNLIKDNLAKHRSRLQFETNSPPATLFLKRYHRPPIMVQLKNWLAIHSRKSCGRCEFDQANHLAQKGINTPTTVCYGEQWSGIFEKRSFIISRKIANAESLEKKLPGYFDGPITPEKEISRRKFISQLAEFVRKFHETGFRHRDLYLCHIFYDTANRFHLIDLARAFKPILLTRRYRIKDIAQLYYSAPRKYFSKTDRLRFYYSYTGRGQLSWRDKIFIAKIKNKVKRMTRHDIKHSHPIALEA